jgi:hypothetical protein
MAVRVEFKPAAPQVHTLVAPDNAPNVSVVAEKPGPVKALDKAKGYYKALIALVGSLLVAANQVLPVVPQDAKGWVSSAITVLTVASVALKANENWFDGL